MQDRLRLGYDTLERSSTAARPRLRTGARPVRSGGYADGTAARAIRRVDGPCPLPGAPATTERTRKDNFVK